MLEPNYEIRQTVINHQLPGSPVVLNVGIRYLDSQGDQYGPESGMDLELEEAKLNSRASVRGRPVWDEDDVLTEVRSKLGSTNVQLSVPPVRVVEEV